jgi:hypothetical protein
MASLKLLTAIKNDKFIEIHKTQVLIAAIILKRSIKHKKHILNKIRDSE